VGSEMCIRDRVVGRAYDVIVNLSGKRFHPEFFVYMFEDAARAGIGVSGFQVEQDTRTTLVVRLVRPGAEREHLQAFLTERIKQTFDQGVDVRFEAVESVERESSGKMRIVKCTVHRGM